MLFPRRNSQRIMQISQAPPPHSVDLHIRIYSLACRLLLWVDNVTRVVVKNNSLLARQTLMPKHQLQSVTPTTTPTPAISYGARAALGDPKAQTDRRTDGQACRQFLLSWLQNLYYFKQFVIVLPALRRKMTSLAKSFTSLQPSDFIYLAAIL